MNIKNRLKIVVWKAKTAGKIPDYTLKTKCPICGGKIIISDEEMDKYTDYAIKTGTMLAQAENLKAVLPSLPKARIGVWVRYYCENYDCEFNGEEDAALGGVSKAQVDNRGDIPDDKK